MPRPKTRFVMYELTVRKKHGAKQVLSSFDDGSDFLNLFSACLRSKVNVHQRDEEAERVVHLKKIEQDDRNLYGRFETGQYGERANIVEATAGAITYRKTPTDATLRPVFFAIAIPQNREIAILALQHYTDTQSKAAFLQIIKALKSVGGQEYSINVRPLVSERVFNEWLGHGQIQKLSYTRYKLPDDLAEMYDRGFRGIEGTMQLQIKARRGKSLPIGSYVRRLVSRPNQTRMYAIDGLEFDDMSVSIKLNGSTRTLDFNRGLTAPAIDLTQKLRVGRDGQPTFESLRSETSELLTEYFAELEGQNVIQD